MVAPVDHATLSAMNPIYLEIPRAGSETLKSAVSQKRSDLGLYFAILRHRGTGIDVAARSRSFALIVSHKSEKGLTISASVILSIISWGRLCMHCHVRRSVISCPLRD